MYIWKTRKKIIHSSVEGREEPSWVELTRSGNTLQSSFSPLLSTFSFHFYIINTSLKLCYICLMHTFVLCLYEWTFLRKCTVISSCPPKQKWLGRAFKYFIQTGKDKTTHTVYCSIMSGGLQGEDQVVFKSSSNFSAFHHFLAEEVVNIVIKIWKLYYR